MSIESDSFYNAMSEGLKNDMGHLTERQQANVKLWTDLQETLNRGDFAKMDDYFTDDMTYSNPSRPDLGTYAQWKISPMELYKRFPPAHYETLDAVAKGDNEIWIFAHQHGALTGGRYMGVEPQGQEISVYWFSIVKFRDGKIKHIYSIADVLGMLIQIGVVKPDAMPVDPYK